MSFLFAAVWRPGRGVGRFPHLGKWFAVAAIAGGGVIEILQTMTAKRAGDLDDLVAEAIGTAAALSVHALIRRRSTLRLADAEVRGRD